MQQKLSVLILTFNHEHYIKQCIDSVLNQKTNFYFEIVILDDSSTDKTSQIISNYTKKNPNKIKHILRNENIGTVENFYQGMLSVKSQYFAIIEGDDYWCDTKKLQEQVNALDKNLDCSFCGHNTIYNDIKKNKTYNIFSEKTHNIKKKYIFPKTFNKRNFVKCHPSSRVFRTSCINFKALKNKGSICWDSCAYWYFLSKGSLYYIHKSMSVYNYTGKGVYSGKQKEEQQKLSRDNIHMINHEFNYKYDIIFKEILKVYSKPTRKKHHPIATIFIKLKKLVPFTQQKKHAKDILLFYFDSVTNFGDILSYELLDLFKKTKVIKESKKKATVCFIGSLLECLLTKQNNKYNKKEIIIAGTGFISPKKSSNKESFFRPLNILGLRGHLSKKRMETILNKKLPHIILGDPGLLATELLTTTGIIKQYDVGIIPHYIDQNSSYLKNIQLNNTLLIDIKGSTQKILREIASCKFILSSAMHGLIAADSLMIPNRRIILSDKIVGGDYKFNDYYSIFKKKHPNPIDLRKKTNLTPLDIETFKQEYHISLDEINNIKKQLKKMINST